MPNTYANSVTLTVAAMLKTPTRLSREITALTNKRLVSRKLFNRGPSVEGGAVQYEREQGIYMDRDAETIAERAKWPRTGYSEDIRTAKVDQYGLEFPVSNLSVRRNRTDVVRRGQVRLGNTLAKNIDAVAINLLQNDADIQTMAASAVWTNAATGIISDIAAGEELIEIQDLGYNGFDGATLVLHTKRRDDFLKNTGILAALPREAQNGQIQTGVVAPILGLRDIVFTPVITETVALLLDTSLAGTVMDEQPDPREGWVAFNIDPTVDPVYVQVYEDKTTKDNVVAAGRWPVFFLTDPKAVIKITGVA